MGMRAGDPVLEKLLWIKVVPPVAVNWVPVPKLAEGEIAAISLALAVDARVLLIDEQLARRVATGLGLPVVGTLGVLLAAKQSGLLAAVAPVLDLMITQGRHIGGRLYAQVLATAGESA